MSPTVLLQLPVDLGCAGTTKCAIGLKRDMRTCSHASSRSASWQEATPWSDWGGSNSGGSNRAKSLTWARAAGAYWFRDGKIITWQPFETHAALKETGLEE